MKTHNASIYHCISCGRVVHAEVEANPPQCCGQTMTQSVSQTIPKSGVPGEQSGGHSETSTPETKGPEKPR